MNSGSTRYKSLLSIELLLVVVATIFVTFVHLDHLPVRVYDESRLAVSALEMSESGNYLIPTYEGAPEMWSTKPPLMIWAQTFFVKLIGPGETAIRLPSAFAALFTSLLLFAFCRFYLKKPWMGFIIAMVLITSDGYIDIHCTMTGDYDAMLTFFTTAYCLFFFIYLEEDKRKYLYLFFAAFILASLTKGVAALMFLPALFIYSLYKRKLWSLLRDKNLYIGIGLFFFFVLGYYFLREIYNPGYLKAVWENEIGGRYMEENEGHGESNWFYVLNFINYRFPVWNILLPVGLFAAFFIREKKISDWSLFCIIAAGCFLLVISLSKTKLVWYDEPMYPFMAVITGLLIYWVFDVLKNSEYFKEKLRWTIWPYLFLILAFLPQYEVIRNKVRTPSEEPKHYKVFSIGYYLKSLLKENKDVTNTYICFEKYHAHILFYIKIFQSKGFNMDFADWKELKSGQKIIASEEYVQSYIETNYTYEMVEEYQNVKHYKILASK